MNITEIAFTGYAVTDMKRAKGFYEGFLGLKKSRALGTYQGDDQWVEYDIGSGCLVVVAGGGADWLPSPVGTAVALEVDDLDAYVAAGKKHGVKEIFPLAAFPGCRRWVIADPDGNRVVLHQRARQA